MDDADLDLLLALADEAEEEPVPAQQEPRSLAAHHQREPAQQARPASQKPAPRLDTPTTETASRNLALPRSISMPSGSMSSGLRTAAAPRAQSQPSRQVADGYTDSISGFRVSKPVIGSLVLKDRLTDDCVYIGLKDISPFRENAGRWATMAVLVSKVQASGRDGTPYGRWTLTDLAGKQVTLFLWRGAASEHYKEPEGSLLLLWSPQVRRDESGGGGSGGGGGGVGYSLHIDKPEMLQRPGMSADFGLCRGTRKDGQRCTMPINKNMCEYCPYHAQAALRALSSNRSDMVGANLLQRQLLPQARAAQKQLASTTGKPMGGLNSLIARPPPPKLLPGGAGGGARQAGAAPRGAAGTSSGSAVAAAAAAGTGAYGVAADSAGDVGVGGKRSYGAQLLANLQERQASMEDGGAGPAAKRRRSSADPWDENAASAPISAAKARAIAAAKAAGQIARQPSAGGGGGVSARTPGSSATTGTAAEAAARRPTATASLRISMPPPLPAHLASLLKAPSADSGATPPAAAGACGSADARAGIGGSGGGGGAGDKQGGSGEAALGTEDEVEEDLLVVELEEEDEEAREGPLAADLGTGLGSGRAQEPDPGSRSRPRSGSGTEGKPREGEVVDRAERSLDDGSTPSGDRRAPLETEEQQQAQERRQKGPATGRQTGGDSAAAAAAPGGGEPEAAACDGSDDGGGGAAAAPAGDEGGGSGPGDGGAGEACGLDELLEIFPELQDTGDEEAEEQDGDASQRQQGEDGPSVQRQAPQTRAGGAPAAVGGGGVRAGTGAPAAVTTGLLPRVAGLSAPPAVRAAEARKQQAAATKVRNEKLKALGMKAPAAAAAAVPPTAKPLGAANLTGRPAAAPGAAAAAAAALAAAKGLPMPRARAREAAAQAPAAPAAAGPSSALAAAFGNLVQQLPTIAVESRYTELSEDAAGEAVLSMLEGLEARDALVQQLDSITHLKVTAWHCAQCNRLSEFLDKQCRSDGHTLSKTTTLKRFWTCDHCNARITTLGVRFPANRCSRCNNPSLEFTACSMYRGPRELKPAGMAAASGLASKENLFATIEQHPEIGRRTFRG